MENFENYQRDELTINPGKAQILGIIYALPFILFFTIIYYLFWDTTLIQNPFKYFENVFGKLSFVIVMTSILIGVVIHELIHGLTWSKFSKDGLRSIKFGVVWKYVTPYCHCKEPLTVKHYLVGAIMPAIILGFIPSIIAICIGNFGIFIFGLFFTISAGGDLMMINLLRKEPMNHLVQDHSSIIGCYIYRPKNTTK